MPNLDLEGAAFVARCIFCGERETEEDPIETATMESAVTGDPVSICRPCLLEALASIEVGRAMAQGLEAVRRERAGGRS